MLTHLCSAYVIFMHTASFTSLIFAADTHLVAYCEFFVLMWVSSSLAFILTLKKTEGFQLKCWQVFSPFHGGIGEPSNFVQLLATEASTLQGYWITLRMINANNVRMSALMPLV